MGCAASVEGRPTEQQPQAAAAAAAARTSEAPRPPPVSAEPRPSIVAPAGLMPVPSAPRASSSSPPKRSSTTGKSPYGPLSEQQHISRLAHSGATLEVSVPVGPSGAAYTAQYAWVTQRSYYPDQPTKANQDACCVHTQFGGRPDMHLFGVFDGHGEKGTPCSQFVAEKLPPCLAAQPLLAVSPEAAHAHAFVEVNRALRASKVDDSLSGTTAITLLVQGASLVVANVGDSRACLAEESGRKLTAFNLSCDQTPFRADECARVRRAGARVLTLDQMEGLKNPKVDCWGDDEEADDGDPPRLWLPNGSYPGTAFTRSLGDGVAERIGVIPDPEVEAIALSGASRFAVVASDGVFEFLPSQAVVDMVAGFDDPLEACFAVVAESYRLWLQYETRTDDITIVVVRFKGVAEAIAAAAAAEAAARPPTPASAAAPAESGGGGGGGGGAKAALSVVRPMSAGRPGSAGARARPGSAGSAETPRPVRRTIARSKREAITASLAAMAEEPEEAEAEAAAAAAAAGGVVGGSASAPPPAPLSPADQAALGAALRACFLFAHLSDAQRGALALRFARRAVGPGEVVVTLGDRADAFYVVAAGDYDVYLTPDGSGPPHFTYSAVQGRTHPSFGELGLLYNQPRTATVRSRSGGPGGVLWVLSRPAFRGAMRRTDRRAVIHTLRTVAVLDSLTAGQLQRLADLLQEATFKDGDTVITAGDGATAGGDPGEACFYVVETGAVRCAAPAPAGAGAAEAEAASFTLGPGQTFGERGLLSHAAPRPHTVTAVGPTRCLRISRSAFEEVLGPLAHIIDADRRWRERAAKQMADAAQLPSLAALRAFAPADLGPPKVLWTSDVGRVAVCPLLPSSSTAAAAAAGGGGTASVTLRQVALAKAASAGRQASVLREMAVCGVITPMPFIPAVVRSFDDAPAAAAAAGGATWLTSVLATSALGTLGAVFTAPLSETGAAHYVACAALALEHVHMHGAVYRGLHPDSALLDADGHLQLVDFRFAKQLLAGPGGGGGGGGGGGAGGAAPPGGGGGQGRTFTLCGHPEYLSPEQVKGSGHAEACDWWALGVFAWWLAAHATPFGGAPDGGAGAGAGGGDVHPPDEVAVYKAITAGGPLPFPPAFSPPFRALLTGLLTTDPDARPGAGWVRAQPWFAACGVDWDQKSSVMTDEVPIPGDARAMVEAYKRAQAAGGGPHDAVDDLAGVQPVDPAAPVWWQGY